MTLWGALKRCDEFLDELEKTEDQRFIITKLGAVSEIHLGRYNKAYAYVTRMNLACCTDHDEMRRIYEAVFARLEDPEPAMEYYKKYILKTFL